MNSKVLFCIFILALLVNGCVSEFNAKLPSNDVQILIVDGSIIENTDATFYLSKSFPLDSRSVSEENLNINAGLSIIGSNGYKSQPAINLGKGVYRISVGELDDNVEYGIQIEYNGDIYQSTLSKPLRTPEIDSISWAQPEKAGAVSFRVSTHDNTEEARFFIWNYIETWETAASFETTIFFDPENYRFYTTDPAPYYYCWKSNASNRFLIGSTESLSENRIINKQLYSCLPEDNRFIILYSVDVNQKAISKSAFEYYQNKIVLNDEMGGLFTPQPLELSGNITCITDPSKKVMGYVEAVKNTTQKRIFVFPSELTRSTISNYCYTITQDSLTNLLNEMGGNYLDAYYELGLRPAVGRVNNMVTPPVITPTEWAPFTCTNCVANGGSKNKPDFWPNNHQ